MYHIKKRSDGHDILTKEKRIPDFRISQRDSKAELSRDSSQEDHESKSATRVRATRLFFFGGCSVFPEATLVSSTLLPIPEACRL
jgi:hypothetical protein